MILASNPTVIRVNTEPSTYVRTTCCDAPVVQGLEFSTLLMPVLCARCGREAGAPGIEDVRGPIGLITAGQPGFPH